MYRLPIRTIVLAIMLCASPAARAEGASADAAATDAAARAAEAEALLREGVDLRLAGDETTALERFLKAHELAPTARTHAQVGLAAKSVKRYVLAARHLDAALQTLGDPWVTQHEATLKKAREIVRSHVAGLLVRSKLSGAELWADGVKVADLPMRAPELVPAAGAHLELRARGHAPITIRAALRGGETTELELPAAVSAPVPDRKVPRSPSAGAASPLRPWIYTTLAIGGVGVGVGTYLGARALQKKEARDEVCPEPRCPTEAGLELDRDARTSADAATATFVVGGTALASALTLFIFEITRPGPAPAVVVSPHPQGGWFVAQIQLP